MAKKSGTKKVLVIGLIAGLIAVLVAVWKASKPVEDPWENEAEEPDIQQPVTSREATVDEVRDLLSDDD